jgi:hypothetical protein
VGAAENIASVVVVVVNAEAHRGLVPVANPTKHEIQRQRCKNLHRY